MTLPPRKLTMEPETACLEKTTIYKPSISEFNVIFSRVHWSLQHQVDCNKIMDRGREPWLQDPTEKAERLRQEAEERNIRGLSIGCILKPVCKHAKTAQLKILWSLFWHFVCQLSLLLLVPWPKDAKNSCDFEMWQKFTWESVSSLKEGCVENEPR